jgi:cyclophilin family peptidyl-prolyl cis-trans isomerase
MTRTALVLAFLSLFFVAPLATADPDPLLVSPGRIAPIAELIGQSQVDKTMAKITTHYDFEGPGSWGYEWNALGQKLEEKADKKLAQGKTDKALEGYRNAQQVYRLGYFPENFRHDERIAWAGFAAIHHKINGLVETPFVEEVLSIDGHAVTIQLYLPPAGGPTPGLVLYTGGSDGSKESGLEGGQLYAAAGYATAAFDLQGTGELVDWIATPDSFSLHQAILDHYENDPRFDFNRVGVQGGSFGGYYTIQLAGDGVEPRLKGSINHCGLVSFLFENPPPECIDPSADYQATVTTSVGEFTVDLDAAAAPGTVNNFVVLSRYGYFDGVAFHRIIPGFVVQGGDAVGYPQTELDAPAGATTPGTGNPGYAIPDELPAATDGGTAYAVGSLAMANSGPDTGGSQWFVVTGAQGESLPADFSLFGSVAEGMDVVTAIEAVGSAGEGAPTAEIVIESITITGP